MSVCSACVSLTSFAAAGIEAFICLESVLVSACTGARMCALRSVQQSRPGPPRACLPACVRACVPPDVTLLCSGSHSSRSRAPNGASPLGGGRGGWAKVWAGTRATHGTLDRSGPVLCHCFHSDCDRTRLDVNATS